MSETLPDRLPATEGETSIRAELTHFDESGRARMVDVSDKLETRRTAIARGRVVMLPETLRRIQEGQIGKGDVLTVAQIAGIMGAKRTSELVPMCHPIPISGVTLRLDPNPTHSSVDIEAMVRTTGQTGVEMEALTAVSIAALTVYDMCKAIDRGMRIDAIRLVEKVGGKSGHWQAPETSATG